MTSRTKRRGIFARLYASVLTDPKMINLSDAAYRIATYSWAYARQKGTDGRIDEAAARVLTITSLKTPKQFSRIATELENAGLWERKGNGWVIHDYAEHQETASEVETFSEIQRKRARHPRGAK